MKRFWEKVDIRGPDECWPWKLSLNSDGYGQVRFEGKVQKAHRVAFKLANPEVDIDGLDIHHIDCETKACCNPEHLEDRTPQEHRRRPQQTHCKNGHELTPENKYVYPNGRSYCRECRRLKGSWRYKESKSI